jgi:hypothetical protein
VPAAEDAQWHSRHAGGAATHVGLFDFLKRREPTEAIPPVAAPLSENALALLEEVARDAKGELVRIRVPGQVIWDTNGKQFTDEKGPGKQGRWKVAVEELVAADLLGPIGMRPYQLYLITEKGVRQAASAAAPPAT